MLEQGKEYILTTDESVKLTGDEKQFYVDYEVKKKGGKEGGKVGNGKTLPCICQISFAQTSSLTLSPSLLPSLPSQPLYGSTKKGDPVLIDDGNVVLEVTGHVGDGHGVICKALNSGKIKNRRGVNVPNSKVGVSTTGRAGKDGQQPCRYAEDRWERAAAVTRNTQWPITGCMS